MAWIQCDQKISSHYFIDFKTKNDFLFYNRSLKKFDFVCLFSDSSFSFFTFFNFNSIPIKEKVNQ
jgi:hypothetical protein